MIPRRDHDDIMYPSAIRRSGAPCLLCGDLDRRLVDAVAIAVVLYWLRILCDRGGLSPYFSIAPTRQPRFQFVLAIVAQSTAQKSVLWWAAKHRHHHLHSDTEEDVHSRATRLHLQPCRLGVLAPPRLTDLVRSRTSLAIPTHVLHRYELVPAIVLALICLRSAAGPAGGRFFWSTVAVYHATFCINSLAHVRGRKRYVTGDDSRNNWLLAFFTMGEGWHNNHHAYQSSVRQGFAGGRSIRPSTS